MPKPEPIPDNPLRGFLRGPTSRPNDPTEDRAIQQPSSATAGEPSPPHDPRPTISGYPGPPSTQATETIGPLGGRTTVTTAGKLRKTVYFAPALWLLLQQRARERKVSYSELIEDALRSHL